MNFDEVINRRGSESYKWREYPEDVLPMFVADMDFRSPEPVARALRAYIEDGVFGYPRALHAYDRAQLDELRGVVVNRMAWRYKWSITAEAVVIIPGVVPGLNLAAHSSVGAVRDAQARQRAASREVQARRRAASSDDRPRSNILVQPPVYPPVLSAPKNAHLQRHEGPLVCRQDGTYSIDWDSFTASITPDTRMFILCNPHNPVGRVFRRDELLRMAEICLSRNVTICADEIHRDLLFDGREHIPIASLASEIAEQTITLIAPSKTFNLAGLQCGFAIIPNSDMRRQFQAAREGLTPWVNTMGLIGAEAAYREGQPWLDQLIPYLQANRDFLYEFVERELPGIKMSKPEGSYLAWLDCRSLKADNSYEFFLERGRVALSDGQTFGTGGAGFVRLNFGCPRATLQEGLTRMKHALNSL